MPNLTQSLPSSVQQQFYAIERPLAQAFAPYALTSEFLVMIPLMPEHRHKLHADIFSQPQVMHYFGRGKSFTFAEYASIHLAQMRENALSQYAGCLAPFTWTLITKDGIAGCFYTFATEERVELGFCISPAQQGRAIAHRASELIVAHAEEETSFIATTHPQNKASAKSLEKIRYPDGAFVFFRDPQRQNVRNVYGANQHRDYFLSQKQQGFSFFSFTRGHVHVDTAHESPANELQLGK